MFLFCFQTSLMFLNNNIYFNRFAIMNVLSMAAQQYTHPYHQESYSKLYCVFYSDGLCVGCLNNNLVAIPDKYLP